MNFRCYHISNMYLNGIHAGIQSAHSQHEFARKYAFPAMDGKAPCKALKTYREWAENHKVIVCLNGGMSMHLEALVDLMKHEQNDMPWVEWRESEEALNGAITNVAIVLPDRIYSNNLVIGPAVAPYVFGNKAADHGVKVKTGRGEEVLVLFKSKTGWSSILMDRDYGDTLDRFTEFETHLMASLSGMRLMN